MSSVAVALLVVLAVLFVLAIVLVVAAGRSTYRRMRALAGELGQLSRAVESALARRDGAGLG